MQHAGAGRVVVAPGISAARVSEHSDAESQLGGAATVAGNAFQRRRGNDPTEGRWSTEADIVGHDQPDVGGILRSHHAAGHTGLDWVALRLISPSNLCGGGSSQLSFVDDEPMIVLHIVQGLQSAGAWVLTARSLQDGLKLAAQSELSAPSLIRSRRWGRNHVFTNA